MLFATRACWSVAIAGLLVAGLLIAIIPTVAAPAPEPPPKKEPPKKEEGAPGISQPLPFPDLEKILPPGASDPEQIKELRRVMEELNRQFGGMQRAVPAGRNPLGRFGIPGGDEDGRMGARVETPNATLVDQLGLPAKQGIVLYEVRPDSAAAKAGLRSHDILLELNGKKVPSDLDDFQKLLKDVKPDVAVEAVVLRKGKKETVQGLKLPEAKEQPFPNFPGLPRNFPFQPGALPIPGAGLGGNVTITRTADGSFTASSQQGGATITVSGKVENNKAQVDQIEVKEGDQAKKYKSVDDVPEAHRDTVRQLIRMGEGNAGGLQFRIIP